MTTFKSKGINQNLLKELSNLDSLTEIFSFFTEITKDHSRPVSRWWNDLLTKDTQTVFQISKNNNEKESLDLLRKKAERFNSLYKEISVLNVKMKELSKRVNSDDVIFHPDGKRKLKDTYEFLKAQENMYDLFSKVTELYEKSCSTLVTRILNGNEVKIYIVRNEYIDAYIESTKEKEILCVCTGGGLRHDVVIIKGCREFGNSRFVLIDSTTVKLDVNRIREIRESLPYTENSFLDWIKENLKETEWISVNLNEI